MYAGLNSEMICELSTRNEFIGMNEFYKEVSFSINNTMWVDEIFFFVEEKKNAFKFYLKKLRESFKSEKRFLVSLNGIEKKEIKNEENLWG